MPIALTTPARRVRRTYLAALCLVGSGILPTVAVSQQTARTPPTRSAQTAHACAGQAAEAIASTDPRTRDAARLGLSDLRCVAEGPAVLMAIWKGITSPDSGELRNLVIATARHVDGRLVYAMSNVALDGERPSAVRIAALAVLGRYADSAAIVLFDDERRPARVGFHQGPFGPEWQQGEVPMDAHHRALADQYLRSLADSADDTRVRAAAAMLTRALRERRDFRARAVGGVRISGRVLDHRGEEADGPLVTARDTGGRYFVAVHGDSLGRYRLGPLPPGVYDVWVYGGSQSESGTRRVSTSGGATTQDFRLAESLHEVAERDDYRLSKETWQPQVTLTRQDGSGTEARCDGVESIRVGESTITVAGYKSNSTIPDDVTAHVLRRGNGLVLDLYDVWHSNVGNAVSCFRWTAIITGLTPAQYFLTVRLSEDPRYGAGGTRVLAEQRLDTRRPTVIDVRAAADSARREANEP